MAVIDRPLVHPERKVTRFQPIKAWRHFRKLVADKEDTEQVFHIIEALRAAGARCERSISSRANRARR